MDKEKIIVEDNEVFQSYFQKTGNECSHTTAYLIYKDGKLFLMWNTKKGKHFELLENQFSDFINKPIQIKIVEFEFKVKQKTLEGKHGQ